MSAPAPGAAPLWVQVLLLLFAAPAMACIWRFLAKGWALSVQRGRVSDRVKRWEHLGFWVMLWVCYGIAAFIFGSSWLGFRP